MDRVYATLVAEVEPDDPAGFLGDVIEGAQFGWNQPTALSPEFVALVPEILGDEPEA